MVRAAPASPPLSHIFQQLAPPCPTSSLPSPVQQEWVQAQSLHNTVMGMNGIKRGNGLVPITNAANGGSKAAINGSGAAHLDVDFSSLALTRKSKALKLISPATNAPIRPEDSGMALTSPQFSQMTMAKARNVTPDRVGAPQTGQCLQGSKGNGAVTRVLSQCPSPKVNSIPKISLTSLSGGGGGSINEPVSPTSGLPIGSKLRRWMVSPRVEGSRADSEDLCGDITDDTVDEPGSQCGGRSMGKETEPISASASAKTPHQGNRDSDGIETGKDEVCVLLGPELSSDLVNVGKGNRANKGNCLNEGQGIFSREGVVGNNSTTNDAVLRTGRSSACPPAPGIPRNSRLRMWMAKSG